MIEFWFPRNYQVSDEIPTLNREGLEPFKDYEETIYLKQTAVLNEADFWDSLFELEDANNLNSTSSGFGEDDDWMSWGDTSGDNWVVAGKEYNSGQTTTDEVLETGNTLDSSDNNMTNLDNETDIVAINSDEEEQNSNFIAN